MARDAPRVLIADALSEHAAAAFRARGVAADAAPGLAPEALAARIGAYDGLAVRSATRVTAELLAAAPRLKAVGRAGVGVDNIDVAAATARGVVVMNTPFGNAVTTAEHAVAMMMALARRIPQADRSVRGGEWSRARFVGVELAGKTLGLVGCGNVGAIVAERAQGLRMRVVVHDPYLAAERAQELNVEKVGLDALLARADVISLHAPLTDETRGMIDAAALARARPGVRLVNCARGGLVVEADLKAAIESGHVAGAALDVFAQEPARGNPLLELDEVVATPHLGASTAEAQEKVAVQIAEQMADYLLTGAVANAVNMPPVGAEDAPRLRPYMALANRLGGLAGQIAEGGIDRISVQYEGHAATLNARPLTAVVLEGLLRPTVETVNMVNAPLVAKERDIEVRETVSDGPCDYQTLIRVEARSGDGGRGRVRRLAGTLLGGRPRLAAIDDVRIDAGFGPHMLYIDNRDTPGIIGAIAKTLGDAEVNIATFHLGRTERGGAAAALVEVDQPVPDPLAAALRALPGIARVKRLRFRSG